MMSNRVWQHLNLMSLNLQQRWNKKVISESLSFVRFFQILNVISHLQAEQSFMTFEGAQLQGSVKIGERLSVSLCNWFKLSAGDPKFIYRIFFGLFVV